MAKIMMRDLSPELSEEELKDLDALDGREIVYDEDCPEMTSTQLAQFHRFDQIPISVSDSDMKKVRALSNKPRLLLKLDEGIDDLENGRVQSVEEAWKDIDQI